MAEHAPEETPGEHPPVHPKKIVPKKRGLVFRIARVLFGLLLVLLVVVGATLGYFHTASGKARIQALVVDKIQAKVDGKVSLARFDFNLGGNLALEGLSITDPVGDEAVALRSLHVEPSWSDLLHGRIVIHTVAIDGLTLHVVKDGGGGSNLKRLFAPGHEELEKLLEKMRKDPLKKTIVIEKLHLGEVRVALEQPDGTKLLLSGVGLDGSLQALPVAKKFDIELSHLGASLDLTKPPAEGAPAGLALSVDELTTGITAHLEQGKGKVTLHPVAGHVALTLPGKEQRKFDLGLGETSFELGDGALDASIGTLLASAVALGSVRIHGGVGPDGKLAGSQRADIVGLQIDAAKVNELAGKEILAGDVAIETHVSGPTDAVKFDSHVTTQGADLKIEGVLGVSDPTSPSYDVKLSLDKVDSSKLLAASLGIPQVEVEHVSLEAQGKGRDPHTMKTDARLTVTGVRAKNIPVDELALDAHVEGGVLTVRSLGLKAVGQEVKVKGTVELPAAPLAGEAKPQRSVDLEIAVEGDPGDAIARLKKAGLPLTANLPANLIRLRPGDLTVKVKGKLGGELEAHVDAPHLGIAGGVVGIHAGATLSMFDPPRADGKKFDLETIDAHIDVQGLRLSALAALRGKKLPGIDGVLGAKIDVTGTPTDPHATLDVNARVEQTERPAEGSGPAPQVVRLRVAGEVNATDAHVTLRATHADDPRLRAGELSAALPDTDLLTGDVRLPLDLQSKPPGVDRGRAMAIHLALPKATFDSLAGLVPPALLAGKTIPKGDVALAIDVRGTPARPDGTIDLDLHAAGEAIDGKAMPTKRVHLAGLVGADGNGAKASFDTQVWLDQTKDAAADAKIDATVSPSPFVPGPKHVSWTAKIDAKPLALADIPTPNEKLKVLGGTVEAHIDLHGNENDVLGTIKAVANGLKPNGGGPVDANLGVTLAEADTKLDVGVDFAKSALLRIDGGAALGGKGLLAAVRAKKELDPEVHLTLDIPKRSIASLASLKPALEHIPGDLSGHIDVSGTKGLPVAKGGITVDGFTTVAGEPGRIGIDLDAGKDTLAFALGIGGKATREAPVAIEGHAQRSDLAELKQLGGKMPIAASMRAKSVDLRRLLPTFALDKVKGLGVRGQLDWNMDFAASLESTLLGPKLKEPALTGTFALDQAEIDIPHTKRTYRNVEVKLSSTVDALHIDSIAARESDLDEKNRRISIKGSLAWHDLLPTSADVDIHAEKWLLFGTKNIGLADAPRGTLSIDAHAHSSLASPVKKARIDISALEVLFPDRFDKAHQPEDVHVGDLVYLGQPDALGNPTRLGKLALPESVVEKIKKGKEQRESGGVGDSSAHTEPAAAGAAPRDAAPAAETGLDLTIAIAKGAHLMQAPIDLFPEGELTIESRPTGRKVRGKLTIDRGELSLGGAFHRLERGSLTFDDTNPAGFIDLYFKKELKPSALRDVSETSAGTAVKIHMFGPISDRRTVLGGAGSPGALYDLLSMHNEGREVAYTEPDMPVSNSVQFPQRENLLILSFLSVNLPHLIFIDRVTAWSDPYDAQQSYGKIEHYEGERFFGGNKARLKLTERPPTAGLSDADVELDYLFTHTPRTMVGVGVTGGSRGGGGPDLFFEWSTKD